MPGTSSPRSFFTKTSDGQNTDELLEDNLAFKRARFWFWPIVIERYHFFWVLCRNTGGICWFFLRARRRVGFFSMKVCR